MLSGLIHSILIDLEYYVLRNTEEITLANQLLELAPPFGMTDPLSLTETSLI